jgi:GT2 family glycosyltransferase
MDVSFIIVNYNSALLALDCIASIRAFTEGIKYEIILVDNASPDRAIDALLNEIQSDDCLFIQLNENKGFGAGNNAALSVAKGRYLFLLNPDTRLCSNAAGIFMDMMGKAGWQQVAACGADLINEGGVSVQAYGHFPSWFAAFASLGIQYLMPKYYRRYISLGTPNQGKDNKLVDYISGAAMFIRRSVVDQIGLFDEDFFLYFEETEWAYRVKKAGYQLYVIPAVQIIHLEGGSEGHVGAPSFSIGRFRMFEQSRQLFYRKTKGHFFATCMKPFDIIQMLQKTWRGKEGGNWVEKTKLMLAA